MCHLTLPIVPHCGRVDGALSPTQLHRSLHAGLSVDLFAVLLLNPAIVLNGGHNGCLSTGVDKHVKSSRLASFEWSSGAASESGCSALTLKHRRLPAVGSTSLLASVHPCPPTPTRVYVRSTRSLLIDWRRSDHTPSHRAVASEVRFAFYPPCTCIAVPAGVHVLSLRCVCRLTCSNTPHPGAPPPLY